MSDPNTNTPAYNIAGTRPAATACVFPTIIEDLRVMFCGHEDCKNPNHRPKQTWLTITVWDVQSHKVDADTGEVVPTMRARQVELPHPDSYQALMAMLDQAQAHRTGQLTLAAVPPEDQ